MRLEEIEARMEEISDKIDTLNTEYNFLEEKRKELCDHENFVIRRGYNSDSGMSDDRARAGYHELKVCEDCGKYLSERYATAGPWYTF